MPALRGVMWSWAATCHPARSACPLQWRLRVRACLRCPRPGHTWVMVLARSLTLRFRIPLSCAFRA
eukprot:7781184-Alexandrium_andersonii.AAC.1